ncbi:MAG: tetratricopeptide repeat-containing sensor histidine kinase [Lentimicrobium sp.]|nr:tetratricopeptide repeat-containing sensor histidine kinase [Lentimicrobium sp.]
MMKIKITLFLLLTFLSIAPLQAINTDSLEIELNKVKEINKTDILIQLSKANWTIAPGKGMFYTNEAVRLAEKHHDEPKKAKALLYGGVNAWFMGLYDNAIEYYQKSLTIARKLEDSRLCAYNLNNLGMVNTYLKNYTKAIENYTESAKIIKETGDTIEFAKIENNIAELNMLMGKPEEALQQYLAVLNIIKNSNEKVFLIWLYNDIGNIYNLQGKYTSALTYFYKALVLSNKTDNHLGKSKSMNHLGEVYLKQKKYDKAGEYLINGLKYARETHANEYINDAYRNISEYYAKINNHQTALYYYQLHKALSDSILNDNKIRTIVEMQARYNLESSEFKNGLLQKNIEIDRLTIKKNKTQRSFLILLLITTILAIVLIYSRLLIRKKKNAELNQKNNLINEQKNQLTESLFKLQELNETLLQQKEEIRKSEKELEVDNKSLAETNATKDKFFSIIAHDLKGPISATMGLSELLERDFESYDNEQQKKIISYIHQGLQDNFNLLENLLQWAASQRGTISFKPDKIHLLSISEASCNILKQSALEKSIQLINQVSEDIFIHADSNMISTILRNLISNAIKFTPKGGVVSIEASISEEQQWVEIAVKDNGRGMSKEMQSKLFDIASNISTKGTEKESGTGLGLILCKEFVEKQNGKIRVESESGHGSSFYFTIPYIKNL